MKLTDEQLAEIRGAAETQWSRDEEAGRWMLAILAHIDAQAEEIARLRKAVCDVPYFVDGDGRAKSLARVYQDREYTELELVVWELAWDSALQAVRDALAEEPTDG